MRPRADVRFQTFRGGLQRTRSSLISNCVARAPRFAAARQKPAASLLSEKAASSDSPASKASTRLFAGAKLSPVAPRISLTNGIHSAAECTHRPSLRSSLIYLHMNRRHCATPAELRTTVDNCLARALLPSELLRCSQ